MSKLFFTSDTHFDHAFVAGLRGFDSPAEHDAHVVDTWNKAVSPRDTVWHLGDVGMGSLTRWRGSVQALHGTIHLVTGNHDAAAPGVHRRAHVVQRTWLEVFASIQPFARIRREGRNILLSHYPYTGRGAESSRSGLPSTGCATKACPCSTVTPMTRINGSHSRIAPRCSMSVGMLGAGPWSWVRYSTPYLGKAEIQADEPPVTEAM